MIPVLQPTILDDTKKALMVTLASGWWGEGQKVAEFEEKFALKVGAKYAVATNSCTSALDMVLKAYGIKGGELITTPMTFVSDAIVGEWNGMDVTFADIDEYTLCLDTKKVQITEDTKAIIAVDSHGRLADIKGLRGIFSGLVIEDAAHAMYTPGAGAYADVTVWSFQAVKTLPIGDGGMITTNDEEIYQKLKSIRWLGVEKSTYDRAGAKKYSWDYDITQSGIKGYMTDLQAVIGLGQLERIDELCAKRRAIQSVYNEAFNELFDFVQPPLYSHTVQYYTMKCDNRNELSDFLAQNDIATSVHFKPLSEMTYWKKAIKRDLPVTNKVWPRLLSLPVHDALTWTQVEFIISKVHAFYEQNTTENLTDRR